MANVKRGTFLSRGYFRNAGTFEVHASGTVAHKTEVRTVKQLRRCFGWQSPENPFFSHTEKALHTPDSTACVVEEQP